MQFFERLTNENIDVVLREVYVRIENAFFIYVDLYKYGVDHPNIDFYIQRDAKGVNAVMMKYYSGLQVFIKSIDAGVIADIKEYISQHDDIIQIAGAEDALSALDLDTGKYGYMQTYFVERNKFDYSKITKYEIRQADLNDIDRIAAFTLSDEYFKIRYTKESFADEMRNRLSTGYGRCWYLEENDTIFASIQTMADSGGVSESGLLLVDKLRRDEGIAESLVGFITDVIIGEGKRLFGNITSLKGVNKYIDLGSCRLLVTLGKYYKR
jgi:predicted GNAT family acetyltransferase